LPHLVYKVSFNFAACIDEWVQILTFTEDFVFRVRFIANNHDFDELDYLDSKNVHLLISLYSGSLTIVFINKYVKLLQVRAPNTHVWSLSVKKLLSVKIGLGLGVRVEAFTDKDPIIFTGKG